MGTIRFNLRIDKVTKSNLSPIELIYQVKGQRKYFNTGIKIQEPNWDNESQQAIYLDKKAIKSQKNLNQNLILSQSEVLDINNQLTEIKLSIANIEKRFEIDNIPFSSTMVIDTFKKKNSPIAKKDESKDFLFDFIQKYIDDHATTREAGSLSIYKTLKSHLQDYQKNIKTRIEFQTIDYSFFESFQRFLINSKNLSNTTIAKHLSTVKTFLNYARKRGITVNETFKDFKIKKESLEVIALTNEEFERLYSLNLSHSKRLAQVRDIFCFACATGLRFSDLDQLRWEHIKPEEIKITVKKTKESLTIPLNPYSFNIIQKYKGKLKPLPMISNQKLNQYLKGWTENDKSGIPIKNIGLCEMAQINEPIEIVRFRGTRRIASIYPKFKLIGVHTARKTFATLSLEKGMSAEEVMTITGHKDYRSFSRYVKITEQRKKIVMKKAWGEIKPINLKAV